jgi:hypothetical protein
LAIGSTFLPKWGWTMLLLLMLHVVAEVTGICHHAQLFPLALILQTFLLELGWDWDPSDLSLLSSWDDRHEPLYPAIGWDGIL